MKRGFRYEKIRYCWTCGLPQGEFGLSTHPSFKPGVAMKCPFDDLVALLIWYIINTEDIWKKACLAFPPLKTTMNLNGIKEWLMKEEQPHLFYNGLELIIWYWVTYKKDMLIL